MMSCNSSFSDCSLLCHELITCSPQAQLAKGQVKVKHRHHSLLCLFHHYHNHRHQNNFQCAIHNKKFELMLTRCAKTCSNCSGSQIFSLSLQPFSRNSFLKCAPQPKIAKINKTSYVGRLGSFIVIDVDTTKKLVTSVCCDRKHANVICNRFHERLANNDKITTFDALVRRFP